MEVIRGGERDCGQEVCGEVERRGARSAGGVDFWGQAPGTVADEGAYPAEGGHLGCGRRLERQRDLGGAGHQRQQYRPSPPSSGRGRVRGSAEAQTQSELRPAADFRWRVGGEIDRADLLAGPRRVRTLESSIAGGEGCRVEHRREGQRQHNREGFKKNILKPHRQQQWVIPPDANPGFIAAMEDVLETYQKPRDPDRPLVCLDETSKQLIIETRAPIPAKPGRAVRRDYEYERNGVANIFMMFAPLEGWRRVKVTDRHAASDYAQVLKELSDVHFPAAEQITLVQDNLSTHAPASLYAAFPAAEARRLVKRFEWHYTPKHGSWLDMAESELGVLSSQCLSRRIPDKQTLEKEVAAWQDHRNKHHAKADWQFTTNDARVKLKRLYPTF